MSVAVIVFSRDRAMQLDALLSSIRANVTADGPVTPTVIWTASSPEFEAGYRILLDRFATSTHFVREQDFRGDYMAALPKSGLVCHFVDDDVVHRPVNLTHVAFEMHRDERLLAFSLRLGTECVRCYPLDQPQRLPITAHAQPPIMSWRFAGADGDFNYAASLDGHIMRVDDVRLMLDQHDFENPNTLESMLAQRVWTRSEARPKMASYGRACVTGVPANVVTTTHSNRRWGNYATAALNDAYLDGVRIDWRGMNWSAVDAAHCEISFVFSPPLADREAA